MRFEETPVSGAFLVVPEPIEDNRGFFARSFCAEAFAVRGFCTSFPQASISYNKTRGTLRGMHFQKQPHGEVKLIRCTAGAVFDVLLDLRRESPTYKRWFSIELSAANYRQLYVPEGVAHGFQTLRDGSEMSYHISTAYVPEAQVGLRWNDESVGIAWPLPHQAIISERDRALPDFATLEGMLG
ncbi:MAG TPA: dTDP-4-dehydrorhamnose 3,5-epimerase [Rhizomicrobium sp.]|jgi:dTDP-4-dehydrorhamnose 3,5-epimerase|nr:dTDP-4-dehydrorhamnose 3,5-epimerase [Rhizomicrobium sp.]